MGFGQTGQICAVAAPSMAALLLALRGSEHRRQLAARILGQRCDNDFSRWHEIPALALVLLLLVLVLSFAIRSPGHWDDTSYHLPMALHFLQSGLSGEIPEHLRFPLFPGALHLLFALGLALQGDYLAQMLATLPYWLVLVGLLGAVRVWTGSRIAALYALAATTFISYVIGVLGYAYLDYALMLFCWGGALGVLMALRQPDSDRAWILLAAFLFATAMTIKLYGVVWAAGWLVLILMHGQLRRFAGRVAGILLLFGTFWYVRSAVISGDPFHPIGGHWFGHFLWNAQDLQSQMREQSTHGVPPFSFAFWEAFSKAEVLWLMPALLAPFYMRQGDRGLGLAVLAVYGYAGFWFFSSQVDRYLMPWMPVAAFLAAYVFYRFGLQSSFRRLRAMSPIRGVLRISPLLPSLAMVYWVWNIGEPWLLQAQERAAAAQAGLEARKGYTLYRAARAEFAAAPIERRSVVQIGFENGVYFFGPGKVWGDWFGPARYSRFLDCSFPKCRLRPAVEVVPLLTEFKTDYMLINTERFDVDALDYLQVFEIIQRAPEGVLIRLKRSTGERQQ
jgi:hypothetical protein